MLNRMFFFSKTANKFETAGVVALILGLASFVAPSLMQVVATLAVIAAIWLAIPGKTFLKLALTGAFILASVLFLSGTIYFVAITLAGVGAAGVISLLFRYIKAEVAYQQEQNALMEEEEEAEEETAQSFFDVK